MQIDQAEPDFIQDELEPEEVEFPFTGIPAIDSHVKRNKAGQLEYDFELLPGAKNAPAVLYECAAHKRRREPASPPSSAPCTPNFEPCLRPKAKQPKKDVPCQYGAACRSKSCRFRHDLPTRP